jgi:siroheme synthase (precorrin-2 oxidase/ferrochelatase)
VTGKAPLSVTTETTIVENVRKDIISIYSIRITFTLALEKNIKDLVHNNEEKDERIRELEEDVMHNKREREIIKEFI